MPFLYHANEVLRRKKLFKNERDFEFAIFGSLATDLEHWAGVKGAHEKSLEFYNYLLNKDNKSKKYASFALGMHIHAITDKYIEPKYVDTKRNKKLAQKLIEKHTPLHENTHKAPHHLVEQAIDYNITNNSKELIKVVNSSLKRCYEKENLENIAKYLEEFFGTDKKKIKRRLQLLNPKRKITLANIEQFTTIQGLVHIWKGKMFYWLNKEKLRGKYKLKMIFKFVTFYLRQDKNEIKKMMIEAIEIWNDFQELIKKSHKKFDKIIKDKLIQLEKARIK
jgi:hypothetical protein